MTPRAPSFPAGVAAVNRRADGPGAPRRQSGQDHLEHLAPGGLGAFPIAVGRGNTRVHPVIPGRELTEDDRQQQPREVSPP